MKSTCGQINLNAICLGDSTNNHVDSSSGKRMNLSCVSLKLRNRSEKCIASYTLHYGKYSTHISWCSVMTDGLFLLRFENDAPKESNEL